MKVLRIASPCALLVLLAACSGSNGGSAIPGGSNVSCYPGTQVQLANPQLGQINVPGNIGQITIVANGNNGSLYSSPSQWTLVLSDNFGDQPIMSGPLNLVPDPNGPHPYPSDFYYSASVPGLPQGVSWNVSLLQSNGISCSPLTLQQGFST